MHNIFIVVVGKQKYIVRKICIQFLLYVNFLYLYYLLSCKKNYFSKIKHSWKFKLGNSNSQPGFQIFLKITV